MLEKSRDDAVRAQSWWRYAWLPLAAGVLGVAIGVHPLWWPQAQQLLLVIGQAKLAAVDPALSKDKRSEYLVVLRETAQSDAARQYFAGQAGMDYVGESIYPKTLVVALDVPVGPSIDKLSAQPFSRVVLPVLPIFFCH